MERRIRAFFHPSSEILQLSLCRSLYTNLCPRADSRNAIKTGKRGLTFREISLLLSLSLSRVNLVRCIASSFLSKNLPSFLPFPLLPPPPPPQLSSIVSRLEKLSDAAKDFFFLIFNSRYATRTHILGGREAASPIARKREKVGGKTGEFRRYGERVAK